MKHILGEYSHIVRAAVYGALEDPTALVRKELAHIFKTLLEPLSRRLLGA
jgi:hypothetical protein